MRASASSSRTTSRHRVCGPLGQGIEIGIVGRLGIGAEDRGIHVDVHLVQHLGETAAALAPHDAVQLPPPQVFPGAGGLQLPRDRHRPARSSPSLRRPDRRAGALPPVRTGPRWRSRMSTRSIAA